MTWEPREGEVLAMQQRFIEPGRFENPHGPFSSFGADLAPWRSVEHDEAVEALLVATERLVREAEPIDEHPPMCSALHYVDRECDCGIYDLRDKAARLRSLREGQP